MAVGVEDAPIALPSLIFTVIHADVSMLGYMLGPCGRRDVPSCGAHVLNGPLHIF